MEKYNTSRFVILLAVLLGGVALIAAQTGTSGPQRSASAPGPVDVSFVRPGLVIKVTGAEIAADGTIRARFTVADLKGLPLDRLGVETPGAISVSFIAAYVPKGGKQYTAYTVRMPVSPITGVAAEQATGENNGLFTKTGDGEYTYTFSTRAPATIDRTAIHTIGAYGSRNLTEFDYGTQYDDDVFHFVPDGSAPAALPRDVIRTATCNRCHHDMAFHGGSRKTMEVCILCHTPQTTDPDTGNTVDMPVMVHKIHMGADLPTVQAGGKYQIIGNRQSVHDYSEVRFPADARNCTACHEQGDARQAAAMFDANRAACGACHDNVSFATGENHVDLPQFSDNQCTTCHIRQGELELDASILGGHTIPRKAASLPGVVLDILEVSGAGPGKNPTITFSIKDKSGNPLEPAQMARLNFRIAGPATDYTTLISEDARKAQGSGGQYTWTTAAPLPANAKGTWTVSLEGRRDLKLLEGTRKELSVRDTGMNKTIHFAVDGSPAQPRRVSVTTQKCNACHDSLAAHGDSRNQVENCVLCHNPTLVAGRGAEAQPVQMAVMIHRIHRGKALTRPYKVGNANFNEVGYPGDLRNCAACHVNGSEQLPLPAGLQPVAAPNEPINPMPPATAACLGCHDSLEAAAHAKANTGRLGESCAVCHGPDAAYAVNRVHAH